MFEICRACLKSFNVVTNPYHQFNNKSLSKTERTMFIAVIPEMDLNIPNQIFFCDTCHTALQIAYKFKTQCLKTEQTVLKYLNTKAIINLDDFDLKAVAFEFGDIVENKDTQNVEEQTFREKNTSNKKIVDKNYKKSHFTEMPTTKCNNDVSLKSGLKDDGEDITIVEHDVKNFFSSHEKVVESRNYVMEPNSNNNIKDYNPYSYLEKNNSSININNEKVNHRNRFSIPPYNPQLYPHSYLSNQAYQNQNNYIIINNTNMSQMNSMFRHQSELHQAYQYYPEPDVWYPRKEVDLNSNKYLNIHHKNTFSQNSFGYSKVDKNKCAGFGCVNNKHLTEISSILENNPNHFYKKRKLSEETQQKPQQNKYKFNIDGLLETETNVSNEKLLEGKKAVTSNENILEGNNKNLSMENLVSNEKLFVKNTLLTEAVISDETFSEIDSFETKSDISDDVLVIDIDENETQTDIIENKLPECALSKKVKKKRSSQSRRKKDLNNFPIYKDIIDPKSYDSNKNKMETQPSENEEKSAEVIPHLKKFYVCHLCGKLLSTRFYAFHMKTHEN